MIISHKYKFIFLKTNKTAGTSVEIALSKFCGADDVITPVSKEDEKLRKKLGYPGPQNHLAPLSNYGLVDWLNLLRFQRKVRFYNHISAREVRALIDEQTWNSYFKFCIERNPWDRVISHYYWKYRSKTAPPLSQFINSGAVDILKQRGFYLYTIDGEPAVDKICHFEQLTEELEEVRTHLGLPEPLELPRAKAKYRKDKRSPREIFDKKEKEQVKERFKEEIRLFGYEL